jgi:hypothetical protein
LAPGVTGKIQVGADPGDSAQVSVPACGVPLAAGTAPNAPVVEVTDPLEGALLQAASPMAAATAPTANAVPRRERLIGSLAIVLSSGWPAYRVSVWVPELCAVEPSRPPP